MSFSDHSDEKLMRDAAQGRFGAFEEFLDRHQGRVFNFFWRISGSLEAARGLFEGCWADVYRLRASQGAGEGAVALLFSVGARKAMRLLQENPGLGVAGSAPFEGEKAGLAWRSARLNDAILELPLRERAALLLCFFDSLSYAAAAQALNESEENLRTLCGQGLGRLRQGLGEGFLRSGLP